MSEKNLIFDASKLVAHIIQTINLMLIRKNLYPDWPHLFTWENERCTQMIIKI